MKITKKSKKVIAATVAVALVGTAIGYALLNNPENTPASDTSQDTPAASQDTATKPSQTPSETSNSNADSTGADFSVSITGTSSGSSVYVRNLVEGIKNGSCTYIFSKAGQSNVELAASIRFAPPSNYYCNPYSFAKSKFPTGGEWNVKIVVKSNGQQAESETKTITVN